MVVKIGTYIAFCMYRRSYLLWSPEIAVVPDNNTGGFSDARCRACPHPKPGGVFVVDDRLEKLELIHFTSVAAITAVGLFNNSK